MIVRTWKHKAEPRDIYECTGCGKTWKSNAKRIGHNEKACATYNKKMGWG